MREVTGLRGKNGLVPGLNIMGDKICAMGVYHKFSRHAFSKTACVRQIFKKLLP